jgi:hypothetical protein
VVCVVCVSVCCNGVCLGCFVVVVLLFGLVCGFGFVCCVFVLVCFGSVFHTMFISLKDINVVC